MVNASLFWGEQKVGRRAFLARSPTCLQIVWKQEFTRMKTKKATKRPSRISRNGSQRRTKRRNSATGKQTKTISFQVRSDEIHDTLESAIKRLESGDMTPETAKAILEKIRIVQTLLRAATQELEGWLRR
jgi:hypothetical protein